ncbi:hypothetical protein ACH4PU_32370 [Streptomyces sp. NPDC021100]|uniref:hypothetical protein n=1 Tax=Streptomyces sp. NPDC021100 TaxID=3365114 RepID=UPI0037A80396
MARVRRVVAATAASVVLALSSIALATPAQAADDSSLGRGLLGLLDSGKLLDSDSLLSLGLLDNIVG